MLSNKPLFLVENGTSKASTKRGSLSDEECDRGTFTGLVLPPCTTTPSNRGPLLLSLLS